MRVNGQNAATVCTRHIGAQHCTVLQAMNPKSEIGAGAVAIYQQYPAPGQARFPSP